MDRFKKILHRMALLKEGQDYLQRQGLYVPAMQLATDRKSLPIMAHKRGEISDSQMAKIRALL